MNNAGKISLLLGLIDNFGDDALITGSKRNFCEGGSHIKVWRQGGNISEITMHTSRSRINQLYGPKRWHKMYKKLKRLAKVMPVEGLMP